MKMLRYPVSNLLLRSPFLTRSISSASNELGNANRGPEWLMSFFPEVLQETKDFIRTQTNETTADHFSKALEYTMSGGKRVRGLNVTRSYEAFMRTEKLNPYNLKLSAILGLCMEMSQAWMTIVDDIMDESKMRRGRPSWYLKEGIGMGAINDSVLITKCQYFLLKQYFRHLPCYPKLMETFNESELLTAIGQITDYHGSQKPVEEFKMGPYMSISTNKTAEYSYNLPVTLGMVLANAVPNDVEREIRSILLDIGNLYQIQDDYLDCFGDSSKFKKIANDIEERKCTWMAVKFMEMADDDQKKLFAEIYGRKNAEDVNRVKELYKQVGIIEEFARFEEDTYRMIQGKINILPENIPQQLFHDLVNEIYARKS